MGFLEFLGLLFGVAGVERASPQDIIPRENIIIHPDRIEILLTDLKIPLSQPPKAWAPYVPESGSMDPVADFGDNILYIAGSTSEDHQNLIDHLQVGDVAAYEMEDGAYIVHRIYKIGSDSQGRYFIFLGDNNAMKVDKYQVRDHNLKWVSIGVVY